MLRTSTSYPATRAARRVVRNEVDLVRNEVDLVRNDVDLVRNEVDLVRSDVDLVRKSLHVVFAVLGLAIGLLIKRNSYGFATFARIET